MLKQTSEGGGISNRKRAEEKKNRSNKKGFCFAFCVRTQKHQAFGEEILFFLKRPSCGRGRGGFSLSDLPSSPEKCSLELIVSGWDNRTPKLYAIEKGREKFVKAVGKGVPMRRKITKTKPFWFRPFYAFACSLSEDEARVSPSQRS